MKSEASENILVSGSSRCKETPEHPKPTPERYQRSSGNVPGTGSSKAPPLASAPLLAAVAPPPVKGEAWWLELVMRRRGSGFRRFKNLKGFGEASATGTKVFANSGTHDPQSWSWQALIPSIPHNAAPHAFGALPPPFVGSSPRNVSGVFGGALALRTLGSWEGSTLHL